VEQLTDWKRVFRTTTFICAAIVASLFVYAAIVEIQKSRLGFFAGLAPPSQAHTLMFVFYGLAIVSVVLARASNRSILKGRETDPPRERILRLSRASVITAVLAEIPALLGLVLFLLTGSSRDFYFLWFGSLAMEFIFFPRSKTWQDLLSVPGQEP